MASASHAKTRNGRGTMRPSQSASSNGGTQIASAAAPSKAKLTR